MPRNKIRTALVTGGGSGIGEAICLRLADSGHRVIVIDLDLAAARHTVADIEQAGGIAEAIGLDVANQQQVVKEIDRIADKHGIDILVNNAGVACIGTVEETSEADLDRIYNVNVKGVYNCLYGAIPHMKQTGGSIVNMASIASSIGLADRFAYSMSKGAVLTMTLSVARDYVADGIRCNCVAPARVHTPFVDNYLDQNYSDNRDEMFEILSKTQPIGRMGKPEEVAALVNYLVSDEASFITGTNFPIDGGFVTLNN